MKLASMGAAAAAIGLGFAVADKPASRYAGATTSYPPGCAVAINGAPGYLPRASVTIENRSAGSVSAWLEARNGQPRIEFGQIGEGELRVLAHTLPAGRNLLQARSERGGAQLRAVINVANHGAATCNRRYVWRIE